MPIKKANRPTAECPVVAAAHGCVGTWWAAAEEAGVADEIVHRTREEDLLVAAVGPVTAAPLVPLAARLRRVLLSRGTSCAPEPADRSAADSLLAGGGAALLADVVAAGGRRLASSENRSWSTRSGYTPAHVSRSRTGPNSSRPSSRATATPGSPDSRSTSVVFAARAAASSSSTRRPMSRPADN